jgi:hypothetical protein
VLQAPVSPKSDRVLQGTQTPKSRSEKKSRKMANKQDEEKMQQLMFKTFLPPKRKKDKEEKDKK